MFYAMIAVVVFFVLVIHGARWSEVRRYNRGYCKCGSPWKFFYSDEQGSRNYNCEKCGEVMWATYPGVDRESGYDPKGCVVILEEAE